MDKMRMETADGAGQNVEKLLEVFPELATEMLDEEKSTKEKPVYKRAVKWDVLQGMLQGAFAEESDERYEFTWAGKREAIIEAGTSIRETLRPCPEESENWDETENLYIEGDNLDVLKLLQESYLGKVKMIYIDPPYNTGNDFLYLDNFKTDTDEYKEQLGMYDEVGRRLFKNTDANGHFHSLWCSLIYPRLRLAWNLLADDGVIFISMDDSEIDNLKKICDEVFGERAFAARFLWRKTNTPPALAHKSRRTTEYILCYERRPGKSRFFGNFIDGGDVPLLNRANKTAALTFPAGSIRFPFMQEGLLEKGPYDRVEVLDDIAVEKGVNTGPVRLWGQFKWAQATLDKEWAAGTFFLVKSRKFSIRFQRDGSREAFNPPTNYIDLYIDKNSQVGTNESAVKDLAALGLDGLFDFPKPVSLIEHLIRMNCNFDKDSIVLDFYSGSATTAHAVMNLNAQDGGRRKFVMVQLPQPTAEDSAAHQAGYATICALGKERIRRAGKAILAEKGADAQGLDVGFRVFKQDSGNMKDVYYRPEEYRQETLGDLRDNIKDDRSDLDLLYGCMLDWGLPISLPHRCEEIGGATVYTVGNRALIACFEKNLAQDVILEIAARRPQKAVFRDSSFASSTAKINVEEQFKMLAPATAVQVI